MKEHPIPTERKVAAIPRTLHFIWLGSPVPDFVQDNIESFRRHNPDAEIRIWRETDLQWLRNLDVFLDARSYQEKSDVARYEVLLKHGGFYVDTDFECVRSLAPIFSLADTTDLLVSSERPGVFSNGLLACTAYHPFMGDLVSDLPDRYWRLQGQSSVVSMGPGLLTSKVEEWNGSRSLSFGIIPRWWVYPYHLDKPQRANGPWSESVVMVHHWHQARTGPAWSTSQSLSRRALTAVHARVHPRATWRKGRGQLRRAAMSLRYRLAEASTARAGRNTVRDLEGRRVAIPPAEMMLQRRQMLREIADAAMMSFLRRNLRGSDTYVDIGPSSGYPFLAAASCLDPYGSAFALQPIPEPLALSERNLEAWQEQGLIRCTASTNQRTSCALGTWTAAENEPGEAPPVHEDCQVQFLTDLLQEISHIRLLRVSCEGQTPETAAIARRLMQDGRLDLVALERKHGSDAARVAQWLPDGAALWRIKRSGHLSLYGGLPELGARRRSDAHLIVALRDE